jgi:hypothetical protein
MLRQSSFWATAGAAGIPVLVAGLSILAVSDTDHRYGWALVIAGAMIIAIGVLRAAALCGTTPPATTPLTKADGSGVGNTGAITSHAQTGGQTANVIYNVNQPQAPPALPEVHFGDPSPSRETIYDPMGRPIVTVTLYRVPLSNTVPGTKAINVSIHLEESAPPLNVLPVNIHRCHDDDRPYTKKHEVRHGEPIILDVIAKQSDADEFFLWRSDLPEGNAYIYPLSPPERDAIVPALRGEGMIVTLRAVPDPPATFSEQSYKVLIDPTNKFSMERLPSPTATPP